LLAESFEERKAALQLLADTIMSGISSALPVTPVPLVASIFRDKAVLTDEGMIAEIEQRRELWRDRLWILREKSPADIWKAAKQVLELRHLVVPVERWHDDLFDRGGIPTIEDAWQWNPDEILVRDYYANSLIPFADVKARGWPERRRAQ
jgi:hypothetical protein